MIYDYKFGDVVENVYRASFFGEPTHFCTLCDDVTVGAGYTQDLGFYWSVCGDNMDYHRATYGEDLSAWCKELPTDATKSLWSRAVV